MQNFNNNLVRKMEIAAYENRLAYITTKSLQMFSYTVLNTMYLEDTCIPESSVYIYRTRQCHFQKTFFHGESFSIHLCVHCSGIAPHNCVTVCRMLARMLLPTPAGYTCSKLPCIVDIFIPDYTAPPSSDSTLSVTVPSTCYLTIN
jgi:hypothetical protein